MTRQMFDWTKPPTEYADPADDPRGLVSPMGFRQLPVRLRGKPCEHCVILRQNKLTEAKPARAVKLMVCGGSFRLTVCSVHRSEWMDRMERWLRR